eukprot:gene5946-8195_t
MADQVRKARQEALEEKKKRLEDMKTKRKDGITKSDDTGSSSNAPSQEIAASTDLLVNSLLNSALVAGVETRSKKEIVEEKVKNFTVTKINVDIFSNIREKYSKSIQTDEDGDFNTNTSNETTTVVMKPAANSEKKVGWGKLKVQVNTGAGLPSKPADIEAFDKKPKKKFTDSEKEKIITSEAFNTFLGFSSLVVERALCQIEQTSDIMRNYARETSHHQRKLGEIRPLDIFRPFENESLRGRPIRDIKYSPLVTGLFLGAYGSKTTALLPTARGSQPISLFNADPIDDSPGLVCVWSKSLHNRTEFKFVASSPVLTAVFHNSDQHLVLGGCFNGQILLWDMKAKSLPIQRSSMAGKGHKHPVYAMSMISIAVTNQLVSVSTDGLLCTWDISRLSEPLTNAYLVLPPSSFPSSMEDNVASHNPLNVSSMAFGSGADKAYLMLGSGAGILYRCPLPYRPTDPCEQLSAHFGLVTSIQPHPNNAKYLKNLLLTSSLDWTVKLWHASNFDKPIFEFSTRTYDYVCDVQWSPVHPAIFAVITAGGKLSLWNIVTSTTEPIDTISIIKEDENASSNMKNITKSSPLGALIKCCWSKDGMSLLVSDATGTVHLVMIHQTVANPSASDATKLELLIQAATNAPTTSEFSESHSLNAAIESKVEIVDDDEA